MKNEGAKRHGSDGGQSRKQVNRTSGISMDFSRAHACARTHTRPPSGSISNLLERVSPRECVSRGKRPRGIATRNRYAKPSLILRGGFLRKRTNRSERRRSSDVSSALFSRVLLSRISPDLPREIRSRRNPRTRAPDSHDRRIRRYSL